MQYVKLLGIIDDGSALSPDLYENPKRAFSLPRGGQSTIDIRVVTRAGIPGQRAGTVTFAADKQLLGGGDDCAGTGIPAIQKTGTLVTTESDTVFRVVLEPEDTDTLEVGRYLYDVWWADSGPSMQIVPVASMHLSQAVGVGFATA
jgi:hypothetical protein